MQNSYKILYPPTNEYIYVELDDKGKVAALSASNYYRQSESRSTLRSALEAGHTASWTALHFYVASEEGQRRIAEAILLDIKEDISDKVIKDN